MRYGEAFDFCMAGGKVRAIHSGVNGWTEYTIWFDRERQMWAALPQSPRDSVIYTTDPYIFPRNNAELERWTFEDADPKPTFEVHAEVDDDFCLYVSVFWRGGLVLGTDRDDAVQLHEALGKAITCEACGGYLDANGKCDAGKHDGSK